MPAVNLLVQQAVVVVFVAEGGAPLRLVVNVLRGELIIEVVAQHDAPESADPDDRELDYFNDSTAQLAFAELLSFT